MLTGTLGVGAFLLSSPGTGTPGTAATEPPVPEFTFHLGRTRVSAVDDRPSGRSQETAVEEVHLLLDDLYTLGFVDPAGWEGGTFPGLADFFEGPAAGRAVEDVDDLTLGSAAPQIRRVEPRRSRLVVSLLFDEEESPVSAFAETEFRARGTARDGRAVSIEHEARFLLRPSGDGWRIVGYEVQGELAAQDAPSEGQG
jgi:hypothetical protein